MSSAYMIIDGQWGSCGKGLLAGKLAEDRKPDVVVCNFGPNAGHTYITKDGHKILTSQLPSGLVCDTSLLLIGPGAIIDPSKLLAEIDKFSDWNINERLVIHPRAAVVTPIDIEFERMALGAISSTKKGTAAAMSRKMMRVNLSKDELPLIARDCDVLKQYCAAEGAWGHMMANKTIQIESAQGLELSLNHGSSYPYCTGRDITVEAVLNDVGLNRKDLDEVNMIVRTFPIRVGDEFDEEGNKIGTSGPVYSDMRELSWEDVSKEAGYEVSELTTVTGKIRRVFTWSWGQHARAMSVIQPDNIMMNFVNYITPKRKYNDIDGYAASFLSRVAANGNLKWIGFGPTYNDVENIV